jgi:hypothetical protein
VMREFPYHFAAQQAEFVRWWRETVRNVGRYLINADRGYLNVAEAEEARASGARTRWCWAFPASTGHGRGPEGHRNERPF